MFQGQEEKTSRKAIIDFELTGPRNSKGELFRVQHELKISVHEKSSLRALAKAALKRDLTEDEVKNFDIRSILDKPVQILVKHTTSPSGTYARVDSITELHAQLTAAPREAKLVSTKYPPSASKFAAMSPFEQRKVASSNGWTGPRE